MRDDLRAFVRRLEENEILLRVKREVSPRFELPGVMRHAEKAGKAVLFENVSGSRFPVVNNILGTRKMLALAFDCKEEECTKRFEERWLKRISPVVVSEAPVKEVVKKGDDVDVSELPLVTHCEGDAGPYITAGVVVTKDPDTGIRNVSINRMQYKGKDKLGIRMMPPQHLGLIQEKAEQKGRPLEVAVAIGNHPFELLAATTSIPFGEDEFELAGALREEPLELVKCETVDLEVPANAEIVIEGEVLPNVREAEGPFGDFMQFYVPVMENHVFKVKAITHREDAIYQTIQASSFEDVQLLALSREAKVYHALMDAQINVKAVSLVPTVLACAISIEKRYEGEPKNAAAAAFGVYSWLKMCVVVDHDVNVFDVNDVWWAIASRANLGKGVTLIDNSLGFPRDPHKVHTTKMMIDATIPLGEWAEYRRKRVPGADEIRLDDYLK